MAKLDDYAFPNYPLELINFKDDTRDLINHGKIAVGFGTAAPSHRADPGEMFLLLAGTASGLYGMMTTGGTLWSLIATFTASS